MTKRAGTTCPLVISGRYIRSVMFSPGLINDFDKRFTERQGWLVVIASIVLVLPVIFLKPMGPDQGTFQSMALEFVRRGSVPYLGSWDMNFPGNVFIHALGIKVFGNSDTGFRLVDFFSYSIATIVLYQLALRWVSPTRAALACFLYVLLYSGKSYTALGERDTFATMILLVAILLTVRTSNAGTKSWASSLMLLLSGLLVSANIMIRPTYAAYALLWVYFIWKHVPNGVLNILLYLAGTCALPIAFLFWYASIPNALNEFYLATIQFNADIYGNRFLGVYAIRMIVLNAALLGAMFYFVRRRKQFRWNPDTHALHPPKQELEFVEYYAMLTVVVIIIMRKFFRYHYEPLFPIFCIILSVVVIGSLTSLFADPRRSRRTYLAPLTAGVLIACGLYVYPWSSASAFIRNVSTVGMKAAQDSSFIQYKEARDEFMLADYVYRNIMAGREIEPALMSPGLRWRAEKPLATRFTTPQPLVMRKADGTFTDYQLEWRNEYMKRLTTLQPDMIVLDVAHSWFIREFSPNFEGFEHDLPALDSLLKSGYRLDTVIGVSAVYRRAL
jgi:hypothetical protein